MSSNKLIILLVLGVFTFTLGYAQEKKDNTGTNPANFTYDTRFYSEMAKLPDSKSSYLTNILEFRWPLGRDVAKTAGVENENLVYDLGKKFGTRMRFRYRDLNIATPGEGIFDNSNVSGIEDIDMRVLWMAYGSKKVNFTRFGNNI